MGREATTAFWKAAKFWIVFLLAVIAAALVWRAALGPQAEDAPAGRGARYAAPGEPASYMR